MEADKFVRSVRWARRTIMHVIHEGQPGEQGAFMDKFTR